MKPPNPLSKPLLAISIATILLPATAAAKHVPVQYKEGLVRGFLTISTLDGETIAGGEINQILSDGKVTTRLTFHFHDGSLHDETAVFTQNGKFRLLSYNLVQKGPSFPTPVDVSVKGKRVTVKYTDDDGEQKTATEDELPPDLANGMLVTLVKSIAPSTPETVVSLVAPTPEPQVVDLKITTAGKEPFTAGNVRYEATHYVLEVDIGGIKGILADLLGKNPPDSHIWIVRDPAPGMVRAQRPFYMGAPLWQIDLTSPVWPETNK